MLVRIVVALLSMIDVVLGHFVTAINMTTTEGEETAGSIATIIHLGTEFYAQVLVVLTNFSF